MKICAEESNEPPGLAARPLSTYEALIRSLSDRLVEAQRPIRILDAIKWDDDVERAFFKSAVVENCRPSPATITSRGPLPFDPEQKRLEFLSIERDIRQLLGKYNAAGQIMARMCEEYRQVVDLLVNRGTPAFSTLSERLYGSSSDSFHAGDPNLAELGRMFAGTLDNLRPGRYARAGRGGAGCRGRGSGAVRAPRSASFSNPSAVRMRLSDGIVADAAAGSDYIKLRDDARFTLREIRLLEVHEGWVHLGTTLNGQHQPICTFLSKGPPSSTITQEGLAVLTEVLSFASHPAPRSPPDTSHRRASPWPSPAPTSSTSIASSSRRDMCRARAISTQCGYSAAVCRRGAVRSPRICVTARASCCCTTSCAWRCRAAWCGVVPLLFCGKTNLADIKTLALLADEGLLVPPRYVPPPFANLHALSAWLCYANFFTSLSHKRIEEDYSSFF